MYALNGGALEYELRIGDYRELAIQVLVRRTTMCRSVLLIFLFAGDTVLFAAGSPDLLVAIRNGDHVQVQKLLGTGADVNTVDNDGTTALMHSVLESEVKMMKLLIGHGANIKKKNALASTALCTPPLI
jgi:ankyrin repeat protein